ncbi:MAG TPA: TRAP transporter large permease subunit, partial [Azonexus sp.]|nr:TRAP transporter large permease subunit [Azonexus sp.]
LYILYVIIVAKLKPHLAPPLPMAERYVELPTEAKVLNDRLSHRALPALARAIGGKVPGVGRGYALREMALTLLPALALLAMLAGTWHLATRPAPVDDVQGLVAMGEQLGESAESAGGLAEPPSDDDAKEAPADGLKEPPGAAPAASMTSTAGETGPSDTAAPATAERSQTPDWFFGVALGALVGAAIFYTLLSFVRLEIFKMLLSSFFPLAIMILAVLGSIVFGLATPTEAAAVGALGGFVLAAAYRQLTLNVVKESVFLTAKTSAMVCWLFVGSSIFSAAFALLGGQALVEQWVLSMDLTPVQFMLLAQAIIFILGWPLEWTEIIVIFMPIFIPLLAHFNIDPLFFGLLVALNLQTAFLSPPVAMAAFYLKGVSPPHVTLNQIFVGMLPFMGIQVFALFLLYMFPAIGLWLPQVLYK